MMHLPIDLLPARRCGRSSGPRRLPPLTRVAAFMLVVTGALFSAVGPASAHAELVSSTPAPGSVLPRVDAVELRWNEEVRTGAEQLRLLDSSGTVAAVDVDIALDGSMSVATITPTAALTPGTWVVTWKVVSGDGHLISGAVPFTLTGDTTNTTTTTTTATTATTATTTATTTGSASTDTGPGTAAVGGELLQLGAGTRTGDGPLDRTAEGLSWVAVLVAAAGLLARRRGLATVAGLVGFSLAAARAAEINTAFGSGFLMTGESRAAAAVAVAALIVTVSAAFTRSRPEQGTFPVLPSVAFTVAAFASQSFFSGHHLDLDGSYRVVATGAHLSHLGALAVWVIVVTAAAFRTTAQRLLVARRLSTAALAVLVVAGSTLSFLLIWPAGPGYGTGWLTIFAAKMVAMLAVVVVGWVHHRRAARLLSSDDAAGGTGTSKPSNGTDADQMGGMASWRRTLGLEVALFVLIAALSATLTTSNPPVVAASMVSNASTDSTEDRPAEGPAPTGTTDNSRPSAGEEDSSKTFQLQFPGGATGELRIGSTLAGVTGRWSLLLRDAAGEPVRVDQVVIEAMNPAADLAGVDVTLSGNGEGRFEADHALPVAGGWQLHVSFLLDQFTQEHTIATVTVTTGAPSTNQTPTTQTPTSQTSRMVDNQTAGDRTNEENDQ